MARNLPPTSVTYEDHRLFEGKVKLIAHENSDGSRVLEVYEIDPPTGLEEFKGFLDRHAQPIIVERALYIITKEIRANPLSRNSFNWLASLEYLGLLDLYTT